MAQNTNISYNKDKLNERGELMDQIRRQPPKKSTTTEPTEAERPVALPPKKKSKRGKWILVSVFIALFVIVIAGIGTAYIIKHDNKDISLVGVKSDKYQALFLTNGQVYFGKLAQSDQETIKISDIYYLQIQQPVQPKEEKQQGETQLIKLGEELHGPEDEMYIDRDQVLFWENLKDNSQVSEAIKAYKKQ